MSNGSSIVRPWWEIRIELLEGILKKALKDDKFNDHSSGIWQMEAMEALGIEDEDEEIS